MFHTNICTKEELGLYGQYLLSEAMATAVQCSVDVNVDIVSGMQHSNLALCGLWALLHLG